MDEHILSANNTLSIFQKDVIDECLKKRNGGLSLPMGSGKTFISLTLCLHYKKETNKPALIVMSKTLLSSWEKEIQKFFGDKIKYDVLHSNKKNLSTYEISDGTVFVLTTPETLSKYYKLLDISNLFETNEIRNLGIFNQHNVKIYNTTQQPFANVVVGGGILYSVKWGCVIVDEIQRYTNILTTTSRSIASLCGHHKWVLSGTMFNEPKTERILGYYLSINDQTFPKNLPDAELFLKSNMYTGTKITTVFRNKNVDFIEPTVNEFIIDHVLTNEEIKIYTMIKSIIKELRSQITKAKIANDIDGVRKYSSYLLTSIIYLRQILVCPMVPIASAMIDTFLFEDQKSYLIETLINKIKEYQLFDWLNDEKNIRSSRIQAVLNSIEKHKNERIVIFTSFRSNLDVIKHELHNIYPNKKILTIDSKMNIQKRQTVIDNFYLVEDAILLLTFEMGSEGLNLQCASTIMLMDIWWNAGTTAQSIARILRFGQKSNYVNVYFYTSNTGIENAMYHKQNDKLKILKELDVGKIISKVKKLTINEIFKLINVKDNISSVKSINNQIL